MVSFTSNFSFDVLGGKLFNPSELNERKTPVPTDDIDPDIQYFNDASKGNVFQNSDYFLEDTFIQKYNSLSVYPTALFSLLHMNIRSIPRHMNELEAYLSNLCHNFSIVAITETWFTDLTVDTYSLQGYTHGYEYRKNKSGGGISLFIREGISYLMRKDLNIFDQNMESLFIELINDKPKEKNIILGVIYRPPNTNVSYFTEILTKVLDKLRTEKKQVYL